MQDRKALQAGTSHFLGQNFSRVQEIKFQDQQGSEQYAWTTSWGVSTRLVGALIMTHSDDDGLVLPPRSPQHAVILPIYRNADERSQVLPYCETVNASSTANVRWQQLRVVIDDRDLRGGEKNWQHIKRGVPLRLEISPKTSLKTPCSSRRDTSEKQGVPRSQFIQHSETLRAIQDNLFARPGRCETKTPGRSTT